MIDAIFESKKSSLAVASAIVFGAALFCALILIYTFSSSKTILLLCMRPEGVVTYVEPGSTKRNLAKRSIVDILLLLMFFVNVKNLKCPLLEYLITKKCHRAKV